MPRSASPAFPCGSSNKAWNPANNYEYERVTTCFINATNMHGRWSGVRVPSSRANMKHDKNTQFVVIVVILEDRRDVLLTPRDPVLHTPSTTPQQDADDRHDDPLPPLDTSTGATIASIETRGWPFTSPGKSDFLGAPQDRATTVDDIANAQIGVKYKPGNDV